jgi:hypothetical protein
MKKSPRGIIQNKTCQRGKGEDKSRSALLKIHL